MAIYVAFKNSNAVMMGNLRKNLAKIKAIKEKDGVVVFAITALQLQQIKYGWVATESSGIVTVTEPAGWLDDYRAEKGKEQKKISREVFTENMFDANSIEAYKIASVNYFINTVKPGIDNATNKTEVDSFITTINYPLP